MTWLEYLAPWLIGHTALAVSAAVIVGALAYREHNR